MNLRRKRFLPIFLIVFTVFLTTLAGCTAQEQADWGGDATVGDLPADMCYEENQPIIISVTIEDNGNVGLTYINTTGNLVTQYYGAPKIGVLQGSVQKGSITFTGDGRACNGIKRIHVDIPDYYRYYEFPSTTYFPR